MGEFDLKAAEGFAYKLPGGGGAWDEAKHRRYTFGNTNFSGVVPVGQLQHYGNNNVDTSKYDPVKYLNIAKEQGYDAANKYAAQQMNQPEGVESSIVRFGNDPQSMAVWNERFKNQPDQFFKDHFGVSKSTYSNLDSDGQYQLMAKLQKETFTNAAEAGGAGVTFRQYQAPTETEVKEVGKDGYTQEQANKELAEDIAFMDKATQQTVLAKLDPENRQRALQILQARKEAGLPVSGESVS